MIRPVAFPCLAIAAVLASPAPAATMPVSFTLTPSTKGSDHVQLTLITSSGRSQSLNSTSVRVSELTGLDPAGITANKSVPLRFALRREAGVLDCTGTAARGRGNGTCGFETNKAFADALDSRGLGRPSPMQAFYLACGNVGISLVDELKQQGYRNIAIGDLVGAAVQGITPDYVRGIAAAGYRLRSLDQLVGFRIQGVTPEWLRGLALADPALARASAEDVLGMRIQGVSPAWARALAELGYRGIPPRQLVAMRIHGISPDFARAAIARTGRRPDPNELVAMRLVGPLAERRK
jgi:hypothetical protein